MKSDVVFDLETAAWPALLVDGAGNILRANQIAQTIFGPVLAGDTAGLATLWVDDNCVTVEKFLKDGETAIAPMAPLKMLATGGAKIFSALVGAYARKDKRFLLLQLLPEAQITPLTSVKPVVTDSG